MLLRWRQSRDKDQHSCASLCHAHYKRVCGGGVRRNEPGYFILEDEDEDDEPASCSRASTQLEGITCQISLKQNRNRGRKRCIWMTALPVQGATTLTERQTRHLESSRGPWLSYSTADLSREGGRHQSTKQYLSRVEGLLSCEVRGNEQYNLV